MMRECWQTLFDASRVLATDDGLEKRVQLASGSNAKYIESFVSLI